VKYLFILFMGLTLAFQPGVSHAAEPSFSDRISGQLESAGAAVYGDAGVQNQNIVTMTGKLITAALSIIGVLLLILIIYAGFLWMTAGGEKDQVKKAKDYLLNAVIGLILILASYGISSFVIDLISNAGATGTEADLLAE